MSRKAFSSSFLAARTRASLAEEVEEVQDIEGISTSFLSVTLEQVNPKFYK